MNNYVITVERGFGSTGKRIACEVAGRLGIPCYEDEIAVKASEESGFSLDLFKKIIEKHRNGAVSKNQAMIEMSRRVKASPEYRDVYSDENIFNFMAKVVRNIAISENCIILGNCANYILRTFPNVLALNFQAPCHVCVNEIMEKYDVDCDEAATMMAETDGRRSDFYKYFTGRDWLSYKDYDAILNPHRLGFEKTIDIVIRMLEEKIGIR